MAFLSIDTPVGTFTMVGTGKAVRAAGFISDPIVVAGCIHPALREGSASDDAATHPDLNSDGDLTYAADAVRAYFDGDLTAIDSVLVEQHSGGVFITEAWDALRATPAGEPATYTSLAARAGRPTAIRGAAQACARNAAALFIPCHRIVRTDGSLGGYRWGLDVKRRLLEHESRS